MSRKFSSSTGARGESISTALTSYAISSKGALKIASAVVKTRGEAKVNFKEGNARLSGKSQSTRVETATVPKGVKTK